MNKILKFIVVIIILLCQFYVVGVMADEGNLKHRNVTGKFVATFSPFFISGYPQGVEAVAGIEFKQKYAIDVRFVHYFDLMLAELIGSGQIINTQIGVFPFRKDKTSNGRGWYSQVGFFAGHAVQFGKGAKGNEEDYNDILYHFITASFMYKATHWWNRHIGFIFQLNVSGGISFYSYETEFYQYPEPEDKKVTKKGFDFADKFMGGLQLYVGVAF